MLIDLSRAMTERLILRLRHKRRNFFAQDLMCALKEATFSDAAFALFEQFKHRGARADFADHELEIGRGMFGFVIGIAGDAVIKITLNTAIAQGLRRRGQAVGLIEFAELTLAEPCRLVGGKGINGVKTHGI